MSDHLTKAQGRTPRIKGQNPAYTAYMEDKKLKAGIIPEPHTCLNCKWAIWWSERGLCTAKIPKASDSNWIELRINSQFPYSDCLCWSGK